MCATEKHLFQEWFHADRGILNPENIAHFFRIRTNGYTGSQFCAANTFMWKIKQPAHDKGISGCKYSQTVVLDLTEGYTHSCRVRDFVRALRRWEVKLRWDKRPSRESYKQLVCAGQSPFFLKSLQVNCSYSGSNLKEQNIIVVSWSLELSQCSNCLRPSNQRKMETWKRPRKERGLTHTFSLYLYATITPRLLTDCLEQVSAGYCSVLGFLGR